MHILWWRREYFTSIYIHSLVGLQVALLTQRFMWERNKIVKCGSIIKSYYSKSKMRQLINDSRSKWKTGAHNEGQRKYIKMNFTFHNVFPTHFFYYLLKSILNSNETSNGGRTEYHTTSFVHKNMCIFHFRLSHKSINIWIYESCPQLITYLLINYINMITINTDVSLTIYYHYIKTTIFINLF